MIEKKSDSLKLWCEPQLFFILRELFDKKNNN
jgi:hypothetical protein